MNEPLLFVTSWLEFSFVKVATSASAPITTGRCYKQTSKQTNKQTLGLLLRPLAFSHQKRKTTGNGSAGDRDRIDTPAPAYYEPIRSRLLSRRTRSYSYAPRSHARIICMPCSSPAEENASFIFLCSNASILSVEPPEGREYHQQPRTVVH